MPQIETSHISVRPATAEHRAFILALLPELAAFGPPSWRSSNVMLDTDTLVISRALDGQSEGASVFVAEDANGTPLGFVHVCAEYDYYSRRACGHIADLVVAPEARGIGVGAALLGVAESWARSRGHSLLSLNVFVENRHARAFYDRAGYFPETMRYVKPL